MKIVLEINEVYEACRKAIEEKAGGIAAKIDDDECFFEIEDEEGKEIVLGSISYVVTIAD